MAKPHHEPRNMGPKLLAGHLRTAKWWQRASRKLADAAADRIRDMDDTIFNQKREINEAKRGAEEKVSKAREEARSLFNRTVYAIEEMERGKANLKSERPVAVVLSPYQHAQLTDYGFFRQRKLKGIDIYVAKGVYGPVILTQDAFNGFTRQAPELNIRSVTPSKDSDW